MPNNSSNKDYTTITTRRMPFTLNSSANKSVERPDSFYNIAKVGPACNAISQCKLVTCNSSLSRVKPVTGSIASYTTVLRTVTSCSAGSSASMGESSLGFARTLISSMGNVGVNVPGSCLKSKLSPRMGSTVLTTTSRLGGGNTIIRRFSLKLMRCTVPTCCMVTYTRTDSGLTEFSNIGCKCHAGRCASLRGVCGGSHSRNFKPRIGEEVVLNSFILSSKCCSTCCLGTLEMGTLVGGTFSSTFTGCSIVLKPTTPAATPGLKRDLDSPVRVCLNSVCAVSMGLMKLPKVSLPYNVSGGKLPVKLRLVKSYFGRGGVVHTTCDFRGAERLGHDTVTRRCDGGGTTSAGGSTNTR